MQPLVKTAEVFAACPRPLTPEILFKVATEGNGNDVLLQLRTCFRGVDADGQAVELERNGPLFDIFLLIALVAAEGLIQSEADTVSELARSAHEPIWHDDPLIACLLAAAIFRFGLRFDCGNDLPTNVLHAKAPLEEFGNAGETGAQLIRKELLAKANPIEMRLDKPLGVFKEVPDGLLRRLVSRAARILQCSLVVSAEANESCKSEEGRKKLLDDLQRVGVKAFFRPEMSMVLPKSTHELLASLDTLLGPFLKTSIPTKQESTTMRDEDTETKVGMTPMALP